MNYEEFRTWRDVRVLRKPKLRLDCMNPTLALDHLNNTSKPKTVPCTPADFYEHWTSVSGLNLDTSRFVLGHGVRDILRAVFTVLSPETQTFWLPTDIYPVYWDLAASYELRSFATLPDLELSFLDCTHQSDCILLPSPLSPLGRRLTDSELESLMNWLNRYSERRLVLDCVYELSYPIHDTKLLQLINHQQCCSIFSTSKAWLMPRTAGIAVTSASLADDLHSCVTPPSVTQRELAAHRFASDSRLPSRLQHRFSRQWKKLQSQIRRIDPNWPPPQTGYFSVINQPANDIWNSHQILAVPASVFGSETELSIVSCLFDIKSDDEAVAIYDAES